jgi:hypothetical protein
MAETLSSPATQLEKIIQRFADRVGPLTDAETGMYNYLVQDTWKDVERIVLSRKVIHENEVSKIYEPVRMGEYNILGTNRIVYVQPRTEFPRSRPSQMEFTQVELEVVSPLEPLMERAENEYFHNGNSVQYGLEQFQYSMRPSQEAWIRVGHFNSLLMELPSED